MPYCSQLLPIRAAVGIGKAPILIILQGDNYKTKIKNKELAAVVIGNGVHLNNMPGRNQLYLIPPILIIFKIRPGARPPAAAFAVPIIISQRIQIRIVG
jgi:hypothetical protein